MRPVGAALALLLCAGLGAPVPTALVGCASCGGVPCAAASIEVVLPPVAGTYHVVASWGAEDVDCEVALEDPSSCGYYLACERAVTAPTDRMRVWLRCYGGGLVADVENWAATPSDRLATVRVERDGAVLYDHDVTLHSGVDPCCDGPYEVVEP